jgi:hypothetical protein
MEAATSIPGHVRAKAEIENLEISEERRRAKTEPTANYALRELDRDDDDHVFEDYYRQKLGVRLMESEERAAWQKKADEIESRRAREIFDAQTDPAKLRQILAREREAYLPELIADKIRNGLEDPGGRGHDFWVPGEFEKAAREQDDARAMMKAAREERDSIKRELLELEAESLSRATSRAQSRHQSRLATPVKKKHGTERERERREGRRERSGSRDGREGETDEERERRRRRKEAKRSKANSRAHSRRQSTRTTPHKPHKPHGGLFRPVQVVQARDARQEEIREGFAQIRSTLRRGKPQSRRRRGGHRDGPRHRRSGCAAVRPRARRDGGRVGRGARGEDTRGDRVTHEAADEVVRQAGFRVEVHPR